jgi:hypothetical protein
MKRLQIIHVGLLKLLLVSSKYRTKVALQTQCVVEHMRFNHLETI